MFKNFFNRPLRILLVTNGAILLASAMLGPIYALFVQKIGGDLMDASIAGSVFALVAGLVSLFSGKYVDKSKNKKAVVVLGYLLIGLGFLMYIWVYSVFTLFIVQALIGLANAIYLPAFDALYSKNLDGKKAGLQWGAWESLNYFTTAIGALIGGVVVSSYGFNLLFILMAAMSFASAIYIILLKNNSL